MALLGGVAVLCALLAPAAAQARMIGAPPSERGAVRHASFQLVEATIGGATAGPTLRSRDAVLTPGSPAAAPTVSAPVTTARPAAAPAAPPPLSTLLAAVLTSTRIVSPLAVYHAWTAGPAAPPVGPAPLPGWRPD